MRNRKLRRRVINRLKRMAAKHYHKSRLPDYVSCGGAVYDHIAGKDTKFHMNEFNRCMRRLQRIDPTTPKGDFT